MTVHYKETKYGFEYGAASVERVCSLDSRGVVIMFIKTPKIPLGIEVYVTKSGKVRIFTRDGGEWTAPSKKGK